MEDSDSEESLSASEPDERSGVGMASEITVVATTSSSSNGSVSSDTAIGEIEVGTIGDAGAEVGNMAPLVSESDDESLGGVVRDMIL